MNLKTFMAMLWRDAHVARRNFMQLAFQVLMQPMMFVFVFGRVMTTSGIMSPAYKSLLLPGIVAISMVSTGIWAVAMPLLAEFQFTREIEDRLLAPMEIEWLAVEKLVAGMIQALTAGLIVLPMARLVMGPTDLSAEHVVLFLALSLMVALLAASFGLLLGCSVPQGQIGLMFSLVVAPMIFFGCTYYPWQALERFTILRWVVLINPLVYASEGFRSALVPQSPHLPSALILAGIVGFNGLFIALGLQRFRAKALT